MENYICKIASREEIEEKCNYEIKRHPNDEVWIKSKNIALKGFDNRTRIIYIGKLNDEIICEATAIIKESDLINETSNPEGLVSNQRSYLCGFRTNKEYEGKGYFSKLYHFMEKDLLDKGYTELCLGVKSKRPRNMQIYFSWGFTNYIRTIPEEDMVNYYYKITKE